MFDDNITKFLNARNRNKDVKLSPLPKKEPTSSDVVQLRRKASLFRAQGEALQQQAAIQTSHKRSAQINREADVAFSMAHDFQQRADAIIEAASKDGMKTAVSHAGAVMKKEGGVYYPRNAYLDVPDPEAPSTWGLRIQERMDGETKMTKAQLGRAAAALGPKGFRGNRYQVKEGGKSIQQLRSSLLAKYRQLDVSDEDIPSYLLPVAHMAGLVDWDITEEEDEDGVIKHFGRKGMRWGQRIFGKESSGPSKGEKKVAKKAKKMSDQELSTAIRRMRMEKEYKDLSSAQKSKGESAVKNVLMNSAKSAAQKHTTKLMFDAITYGIKKVHSDYSPPKFK